MTIAMINLAMGIDYNAETKKIERACIVLGAISPVPLRFSEMESLIINRDLDESLLRELCRELSTLIERTVPVEFEMIYKKAAVWGVAIDIMHSLLPEIYSRDQRLYQAIK